MLKSDISVVHHEHEFQVVAGGNRQHVIPCWDYIMIFGDDHFPGGIGDSCTVFG